MVALTKVRARLAPGERKLRVERHGLLEQRDPTPEIIRQIRGDDGFAGEIGVIGFGVASATPRGVVLVGERHGEGPGHGACNLVLNGEDVAEFLVIDVGPDALPLESTSCAVMRS